MLGAAEDTKKLDGNMNKLNNTVEGFGKAAAAYLSFSALREWGGRILDATMQTQRFNTAIEASSFNSAAASTNIRFLDKTIDDLGLDLRAAQSGYKTFSGAVMGTRLQGEKGNKVFRQIAGSTAVMGLTAEQTEGAFLALGQMISKGTVQAEELRGQLGERIPGAFQIAARAMGMTTKQLGEAMKDGLVESTEFVEKFGNELQKTFGDKIANAASNVQANVNRMSNEWERLLANFGKSKSGLISGISEFSASFLKEANRVISTTDAMSEAFERFGAKDFNFVQQKGSMLAGLFPFLKSNVLEMEKYYEHIQKAAVIPSEKSISAGYDSKFALLSERSNLSKRFANKSIGEDQYKREYAILSAALEKVGGNIDALKMAGRKQDAYSEDKKKSSSSIGSMTEVSGSRPQNIYITLDRLGDVKIEKIETMTEAVSEVRETWQKGFLEVLNDANLIANR